MKIHSPGASPTRRKLFELAGELGIDPDQLRRMLWLINAHPDGVALPTVARNLQEIFAAVDEEDWNKGFRDTVGPGWDDVIQFVIDERYHLQKEVGGRFDVNFSAGHHPLVRDGLQRYSVYATLCNSHPTESAKRKYRLLQAQLFVAHAHAMTRYTTVDDYESYDGELPLLTNAANPYPAALAVRELSDPKLQLLLDEMKVHLSPEKFYLSLQHVATGTIEESKRVDSIRVFFETIFGERVQSTRIGGSGGHRGSGPIIHGLGDFQFYLEDVHHLGTHGGLSGTAITTRRKLRSSDAQRREMLKADVCPTEDSECEELDMLNFSEPGFNDSPGSFQQAAASLSNHLVMANQMFPWGWGKLAISELRPLLVDEPLRIHSLLSSGAVMTPEDEDQLEVVAFVHVLFWTSCDADAVRGLRIYRARKARAFRLGLVFPKKPGIPFWLVRAPFDYSGGRFDNPEPGTDRNRTEYCELPDVADGSCLVRVLLERQVMSRKEPEKRESSRVFRHDLAWYERGVKALIERCGDATRLTMKRIGEVTLTRVQQLSHGETAATAILSGRNLTLAHARLYYACPSMWRMQALYKQAVREIHDELNPGEHLTFTTPAEELKSLHICFRPCPTLQAVRDAVRRIQEDLAVLGRYDTQSGLVAYHNLYTLYTCMMFAYVTGVRGIATPYVALDVIDAVQGLTPLTDKDRGLGYKTRLVWISTDLQDQMAHYQQHLGRLPVLRKEPNWPAFYINTKMRPVEVRPSTSLSHLEEYLRFPINIHRRVVSSAMLEAGCPPEVVDAWMGHWHRGEEPWRPFSSFSFADFRSALEEYLQPLITKQLGFRAVAPFEKPRRTV